MSAEEYILTLDEADFRGSIGFITYELIRRGWIIKSKSSNKGTTIKMFESEDDHDQRFAITIARNTASYENGIIKCIEQLQEHYRPTA